MSPLAPSNSLDKDLLEMEFEDWEYLSDNNLFTSHTIEERSSALVHEQNQYQVLADQIGEDQGDAQVKEIEEISEECDIREKSEECDTVPQLHLEAKEEELIEEENLEIEISRGLEFEEEVEEVKEVDGSESNGNGCENGFNQKIVKWGIGALSSVGIAAATLTMFMLCGSKTEHPNREIQIQNCADDKMVKEVVQQAAKLNQALRTVRATPAITANLSFGLPWYPTTKASSDSE